MKKVLIVILIVILVLAVLTATGLLAYRHFVTERIMDKGGIKNPFVEKEPDDFEEPEDPGPIEMLDGDYTYDETIYEAAKTLYQEYSLGYGEEKSGELLLLSMAERDYTLIAYGYGNTAFTDYGKDKLSEVFLDDFGDDNWYSGLSDYLDKSESML